ncbi:hypothetical protein MCOR27_000094 [Pyricularia oryzae]|uniref:Apple domain-containing protein n=2 Tax=Pyricularia TaxID=48558 RepID=A0ABQ8NZ99_PYRGI|nr:hypothetical protein MCOR01_006782 [Pyricularia oryzae]KAI6302948.1 hypothetical protein MCOR33_001858 [Pyricularia grisea]KAH9436100.1 hypothetical protein MCOR02_005009 [Pyricularia oryzae]KAI6287335.1 hypothetical protein MCOR26_000587 [Pyricularia oryzae]KAI6289598.1 hypothetical protein MCOR27_000094 [Pyricularia oryzae]
MNQASRETGDVTPAFYDPYHPANNAMKEVVTPDHAEVNQSYRTDPEPVPQTGATGSSDWRFSPAKSPTVASPDQPWQPEQVQSRAGKERKVCGVGMATFVLAIALLVVLLAAAVGGGVGGSMAANTARELDECKSNLNQPSSSSTTSQPPSSSPSPTAAAENCGNQTAIQLGPKGGMVVPVQGVTVELNCPDINNSQMYAAVGGRQSIFRPSCGIDYNGNDIGGAIAYSFQDCLWACAAMNNFSKNNTCLAVTFHAALSNSVSRNQINCFLKNTTSNRQTGKGNLVAGAQLVLSTT